MLVLLSQGARYIDAVNGAGLCALHLATLQGSASTVRRNSSFQEDMLPLVLSAAAALYYVRAVPLAGGLMPYTIRSRCGR
jgi:hypothetical protein